MASQLAHDPPTPQQAPPPAAPLEPLAPFELLMCLDDRRGYPMVFHFELTFAGQLDPCTLGEAAARAVARHPRLRSRITKSGGRQAWIIDDAAAPPIHVQSTADDYPPRFWNGIDLRREHGLRLVVHVESERSQLLVQFHHACCDGMGALAFLGDLLGFYHFLNGGKLARSLAEPAPMPRVASDRPRPATPAAKPAVDAARPASDFNPVSYFAMFRPSQIASARLSAQAADARDCDPPEPFLTAWLPVDSTHGIRAAASAAGASLNDVMLRDLFLTLAEWNGRRRSSPSWRRLRILMPINMRTAAERRLPAVNRMSYGFLQRRAPDFENPRTLLEGIAWETRQIRRESLGHLFLGAIEQLARAPRLFRLLLRMPVCFSTAVLSNLGDPIRRMPCRLPNDLGRVVAGNVRLLTLVAAPPVRPRTGFAVAFTTYADQLGIMAAYSTATLDRNAAQELLAGYLQRLEKTATDGASPNPVAAEPQLAAQAT